METLIAIGAFAVCGALWCFVKARKMQMESEALTLQIKMDNLAWDLARGKRLEQAVKDQGPEMVKALSPRKEI